tara:strand:+ start:561 stop:761 length:201 start_codon:yes stop_codon:yes gene_type:complete
MENIKLLEAQIGELASALNRMNENVTPHTQATIDVANEVFGGTLAELQEELRLARIAHSEETILVI